MEQEPKKQNNVVDIELRQVYIKDMQTIHNEINSTQPIAKSIKDLKKIIKITGGKIYLDYT